MKKIAILTGLLVAAGFSGVASAHTYTGTLGTAAAATDKFYVTCSTGTAKITYRVRRNTGTAKVQAKAYSPVGAATLATTTAVYSPLITLATGAGAKFFEIKKNPAIAGANGYTLDMHCYDTNNLHNPEDQPSTVTYIQNQ